MKPSTTLALVGAQAATADLLCPANLGKSDTDAIVFGYKVEQLINKYYHTVSSDPSFFQSLPNANEMGMNGKSMADNMAANIQGLAQQTVLGGEALKMAGMASIMSHNDNNDDKDNNMMMPEECDYALPNAPNATVHLMNAFYLEASLCGTFIGLSSYVTSPEASFLMARLSAEHGIHASALRSQMKSVAFHSDSKMLTAAFTPDHVLMDGGDHEVGKLGQWLKKCGMKAPGAPCGGKIQIGNLLANLTDQPMHNDGDNNKCGNGQSDSDDQHNPDSSTTTGGSPNQTTVPTSAATQLKGVGLSVVAAMVAAFALI